MRSDLFSLLILLLKVFETASTNLQRTKNVKRLHREVESEKEEVVAAEDPRPRKNSRKEDGSRYKNYFNESEVDEPVKLPTREELFQHFLKFDKAKVDSILGSGYDVIGEGIWNDLIKLRRYEAIKYMLANHFNTGAFHRSVFYTSIIEGATSLALFLIENSTSALIKLKFSKKSLKLAIKHERYIILKAMIKAGFDINRVSDSATGKYFIHTAVEADNVRLVRTIIKCCDQPIDCTDKEGNMPIHYAKSVEMIELLIEHGADPLVVNTSGMNAVVMASESRNYNLVKSLVSELNSRLKIFLDFTGPHNIIYRSIIFDLDRQNILEDSFYLADQEENWYDLNSKYSISFAGETGIDHGGLSREWMSLLIERFFVPRLPSDGTESSEYESDLDGFSIQDQSNDGEYESIVNEDYSESSDPEAEDGSYEIYSEDGSDDSTIVVGVPQEFKVAYYNAPFDCVDSDNKLYTISSKFTGPARVYKFIGSVIAKAFIAKIPLKVKLVPSLMKLIMGRTLTFEDLKADDPVMYRSMAECLEPGFDFGAAQYTLPSDETVAVDAGNVFEFLDETAVNAMYYRHREQIDESILGFRSIIDYHSLKTYFSADEVLEVLLGEETLDRSDLRSVFEFRGIWASRSELFFAALDMLEPWELIELVRFITGINGLPYGGVKGLGKKLTVFEERTGQFIRSSTCSYHMNIPVGIETVESLVESLRISLASTPEFSDEGCC